MTGFGKRAGFFVLIVCLLLSISGLAPKEIFAAEKREIVVGYTDYDQMIHIDKAGEANGYGPAYLEEIAKYTGWQYRYVKVSDDERIDKLANGEIDLLCDVRKSCDKSGKLVFSEERSTLEYGMLCARKEDDTVFFDDYASINGKKIGIISNRGMEGLLEEYCQKGSISCEPVVYANMDELQGALQDRQVDLAFASSLRGLDGIKYVAKTGMAYEYFAVNQDKFFLMDELNQAVDKITQEQPFFVGGLYMEFYGQPSVKLTGLTRQEYQFIRDTKSIRVAYDASAYPVEYEDEEGNYKGVYADALALISEESGLTFEFVPLWNFSECWDLAERGEVDLIAGVYGGNPLKREHGMTFTNSYLTAEYTLVCKKTLESLDSPAVALPKELLSIQVYYEEFHPDWEMILCEDIKQCLAAVESDKADVAAVNSLYLQTVYNLNNYDNLRIATSMAEFIPISIGIGGDNQVILESILNKSISRIPKDEFAKCMAENAINVSYEAGFFEILKMILPYLALFAAGFWGVSLYFVRKKERRFRHLAITDSLTGLWNGDKFLEEAQRRITRNKEKEYDIISIDIERFKYINNDFGSDCGNEVLRVISSRILESFGANVCCARRMADRFWILTEHRTDLRKLLEHISGEVCFDKNGKKQFCKIQVKFGICRIPPREEEEEFRKYADCAAIARRSIKGNRNTSIAYYNKEMEQKIQAQRIVEGKMESALKNHEFQVYYQPKYDLRSEQITGAEALVRWIDPEKGMIPPDQFIPIFEKNGFIVELDFYVYESVLQDMVRWDKEGKRPLCISVNVSRVHVGTSDFLDRLVELVQKYRIDKSRFELELTESLMGEEQGQNRDFIKACKSAGFPVSIDDFGSGYSSLNLLKDLPVDILKIDKAFLDESENSRRSSIIVEQVVEMAKKINIGTLCEGVETKRQADFLRSIGCDMAQGYLFSRPVPAREFEEMIKVDTNKEAVE